MALQTCLLALSLLLSTEAYFFDVDPYHAVENIMPSFSWEANSSPIFYGVMFDAGSTGTRIHIYTFMQKDPDELPVLVSEMFHSVKPGLSAYANMPVKAGDTVEQMLTFARKTVPRAFWPATPVVLRATAGFRLLPQEKAEVLLAEVQFVLDDSPFYVPSDSVGVMEGTSEGILAWVTVNFLTGHLYTNTKKTVGILDLGGGSTQITFLPKSEKTIQTAPPDFVAKFEVFNTVYDLYTYSYLGNGLKAARLATLGVQGSEDLEWTVFESACLPQNFRGDWTFGGNTYKVSGDSEGNTGYKLCNKEVVKVIEGIIHQPYEIKGNTVFYAFSYYYDLAVDSGLVDGSQGGTVEVREFKRKAKEVCNKMGRYRPLNPFLCMDLIYITCLLKEGFGFKDTTVLHLTKKVNNVETSWALGAMFEHLQKLRIY